VWVTLDNADDFVRNEILLAFELEKQVIPVRLGVPRVPVERLPDGLTSTGPRIKKSISGSTSKPPPTDCHWQGHHGLRQKLSLLQVLAGSQRTSIV
jgi:hypothetical protein